MANDDTDYATIIYTGNCVAEGKIAEGTSLTFTVTPDECYKVTKAEYKIGAAESYTELTAVEGTYTVPAASITDAVTLKVTTEIADEIKETRLVTVSYNKDEVEISARVSGKECDGEESGAGAGAGEGNSIVYEVDIDSNLVIAAKPLDNCQITGATTKVGEAKEQKAGTKPTGAEIKVKASDNASVTVSSKGLYKLELSKADEPLSPSGSIYTVDNSSTCYTRAFYGKSTVALSRIEISCGKQTVQTSANLSQDKFSAIIMVDAADAGKKLTVNYYTSINDEEVKIGSCTLNVLPKLTKVAVNKGHDITLPVNCIRDYPIVATPKTADLEALHAEVISAKENPTEADTMAARLAVQANIENGYLSLKTEAVVQPTADVAVVTIKDSQNNVVDGGRITVSTSSPTELEKTVPTVKLKDSDDTTLTLTLGIPRYIEATVVGEMYYKVEVTPLAVEGKVIPSPITAATANPMYYSWTGLSQDEEVVINNAVPGTGEAWKFNVKVTLVQTNTEGPLTAENAATAIAFSSKTKEIKNIASKTSAYETKLTLKKGTTTVYTGQQNVKIATAVFNKNTTHKNLQIEADSQLHANFSAGDGAIYVSPGDTAETGKYEIRVLADAPEGTERASAVIEINVVQGITNLGLDLSSNIIYKAENKAATIKVTPIYDPIRVPKNKKVTYEIVDTYGNELSETNRLYGMITVKNGTVTVNKNL